MTSPILILEIHTSQDKSPLSCALGVDNARPTIGYPLPSPVLTPFPIIHFKFINLVAVANLAIKFVLVVPLDTGRITTL